MRGSDFEEAAFFSDIEKAGVRALLIAVARRPDHDQALGRPPEGSGRHRIPRRATIEEVRQRVHPIAQALEERPLEAAEAKARLEATLADREYMQSVADLIEWFTRRYPTPEERLAYARRKYRELASASLGSD